MARCVRRPRPARVLCELIAAEGAPDIVEVQDYGALAHAFLKRRLIHAGPGVGRARRADRASAPTRIAPSSTCEGDRRAPHGLLSPTPRALVLRRRRRGVRALRLHRPRRCAKIGFPTARGERDVQPLRRGQPRRPAALRRSLSRSGSRWRRRCIRRPNRSSISASCRRRRGVGDLLGALDALHTEGRGAPPVWLFGPRRLPGRDADHGHRRSLSRRHARLFDARPRPLVRAAMAPGRAEGAVRRASHRRPALSRRLPALRLHRGGAVRAPFPLTRANGGPGRADPPPSCTRCCSPSFDRPDVLGDQLAALRGPGSARPARAVSHRLQAAVRAKTDRGRRAAPEAGGAWPRCLRPAAAHAIPFRPRPDPGVRRTGRRDPPRCLADCGPRSAARDPQAYAGPAPPA